MSQTIKYVKTEIVMCDDDHPRVYIKLTEGEGICGYCNVKFIHEDKIKSEVIRNVINIRED